MYYSSPDLPHTVSEETQTQRNNVNSEKQKDPLKQLNTGHLKICFKNPGSKFIIIAWINFDLWLSVPPIYNLWPQAVCPPDITFIATSAKQRPVERASLGLCRCHTTTVLKLCALVLKGLDQLDFLSPHTQASEPTVNSQHCQVHHFYRAWQNRGQLPGGHPATIHAPSLEKPACSFLLWGKIPTESQALLVLPVEADTWCSDAWLIDHT